MSFTISRRTVLSLTVAASAAFAWQHTAQAANQTVRVGIISAEDEDIWAVVKTEAAKQGLDLKLVVFNDYTQPNEALENGELDANAFQHKPYLENQIKTRGYHIVPVGYTAVSLAENAGFKLAASSEANANPKDTKDYSEGVWTMPPTYRLKDKNRDRYAAIGESDGMLLKFVKPSL